MLRDRGHQVVILTSDFTSDASLDLSENYVHRLLKLEANIDNYRPLDFFIMRQKNEKLNEFAFRQISTSYNPELVVVWGMWNLTNNLPCLAEELFPGRVAYIIASYWPSDQDPHHNYWEMTANRMVGKIIKKPLRLLALKQLKREGYPPHLKYENVACVSNHVRTSLIDAGILHKSTVVIYPGIDPEPFIRHSSSAKSDDSHPLRLIYFGSLLQNKGVHTAIEALGQLNQGGYGAKVELTIIGGGHPDYESHLCELTKALGVDDKVTFVGRVPRAEIPAHLAEHDVFLFTSIWPEPMARVVMEAMAAGLVVIGSLVGGQVEMLFDGENSLTFQAEDANGLAKQIQRLIDEPDLQQRLAIAGRELVLERFTLDRMANEIEAWLLTIVNK
jgi:glycosyltransferase involved in cell wall biosynthesis